MRDAVESKPDVPIINSQLSYLIICDLKLISLIICDNSDYSDKCLAKWKFHFICKMTSSVESFLYTGIS